MKVYDSLFELTEAMAEVFPAINPIRLRYEKAKDVIRFTNRLLKKTSRNIENIKKKNDNVVRKQATDWY